MNILSCKVCAQRHLVAIETGSSGLQASACPLLCSVMAHRAWVGRCCCTGAVPLNGVPFLDRHREPPHPLTGCASCPVPASSHALLRPALQEAFDIFGDADEMVAEYQEMQERNRQRGQAVALDEDDGEDLALEEPDEDDEEAMQAYLRQKASAARAAAAGHVLVHTGPASADGLAL